MKQVAHTLYDKPWKHAFAALLAFLLSYGAASLAIDTGRLLVYFAAIVFAVFGIKHLVHAVMKGNAH